MSFCLHCPHTSSEHDTPELGSRCRVRHYHGDGKNDYERCDCSGFEADESEDVHDAL